MQRPQTPVGRAVERRVPIPCPKIEVTARSKELLGDGLNPIFGCHVEGRDTTRVLNIDVATSCNQQLRDSFTAAT